MSLTETKEQFEPLKDGTGKLYKGTSTIIGDSSTTNTLKSNEAMDGPIEIDYKFDQGKPIAGAIQDFGLALMEVSALMTFGAKKYKRSSWTTVENGVERYTDAMMRHFFQESYESLDKESGFAHDVAVAFSALARLELRLREEYSENDT